MFLQLDGNSVFTLAFGAGLRTFLAQGGWIGSAEVWLPTLELLSARSWRTVAFDHRGAGETLVPTASISYDALVDDIFRVMDALDIERCVLGGESAGAQVVLEAGLRHSERFTGLVLVDGSAGLPRPANDPPSPINTAPSQWPGAEHGARMRWFVDLCFPEEDAEPVRRWAHHILMRAEPEAAEKLWGIGRGGAAAIAERIADCQLPVLLVHGARDALVSRAAMDALALRLAHSHLLEVDGAGHVPLMTRAPEVSSAIDAHFPERP